jgi:CheY-like chemotaxis protein
MVTRVLVVEDNPLNLKLIRDVLEYQGSTGSPTRWARTEWSPR